MKKRLNFQRSNKFLLCTEYNSAVSHETIARYYMKVDEIVINFRLCLRCPPTLISRASQQA